MSLKKKDLYEKTIVIKSKSESILVQKALFKLGLKWTSDDTEIIKRTITYITVHSQGEGFSYSSRDGSLGQYRSYEKISASKVLDGASSTDLVKLDFTKFKNITSFIDEVLKKEKDKKRIKFLNVFKRCILPDVVKQEIEECLISVLSRDKFDAWGITAHFEKGITNSLLMYGPPGTGKTMIAESIAAVLGSNLMRISSGDIQSSVPGQTEKNIIEAFQKATSEKAVLLFDECDSILMERNSVGAILSAEINCLLQEIERFDGVLIMTSNRLHKLDSALQRRIIHKIKLDEPNEEARKQIWQNLIPAKMPVDAKMDFDVLAKAPLTGGDIKNSILIAAKKAIAQKKSKVTMNYFMDAVQSVLKAKQDYNDTQPRRVPMGGGGSFGKAISKVMSGG